MRAILWLHESLAIDALVVAGQGRAEDRLFLHGSYARQSAASCRYAYVSSRSCVRSFSCILHFLAPAFGDTFYHRQSASFAPKSCYIHARIVAAFFDQRLYHSRRPAIECARPRDRRMSCGGSFVGRSGACTGFRRPLLRGLARVRLDFFSLACFWSSSLPPHAFAIFALMRTVPTACVVGRSDMSTGTSTQTKQRATIAVKTEIVNGGGRGKWLCAKLSRTLIFVLIRLRFKG